MNKELIDLGLPKENVESITKSYKSSRDKLLEKSIDNAKKLTEGMVEIDYSLHDFLGSYRLSAGLQEEAKSINSIRFAEIKLKKANGLTHQKDEYNFIATAEDIDELIYELEEAISIVEKHETAK